MLQKTQGIVLHAIKYSDNASIVSIYTRDFGRCAYMFHQKKGKSSTGKAAFVQPLTLVEMDVYHHPKKQVQHIKDLRVSYPYTQIPFDAKKNAVAIFISEVLYKTLRQPEPDELLFDFIQNSLQTFDCQEDSFVNFHLVFLAKLTRFLGFEPSCRYEPNATFFDLLNGVFVSQKPEHQHFIENAAAETFNNILHCDYSTMQHIQLTHKHRNELTDSLLEFYKIHLSEFSTVKSLSVLQMLFE
ncbi:MAG: DNA repair protein RecO [Prevotellaceae bacterium]|jgi:DNA repair protein RecO (recombination protein O)|nr:DNA repair protein RecO [Prevotellaceae bacterium]